MPEGYTSRALKVVLMPRRLPRCRRAVEVQDAEAAVRERSPQLVLCCWMPLGVDWSADFRAQSSVREYLLVRSESWDTAV